MTTPESPEQLPTETPAIARDAANWAGPVSRLEVGDLPADALNRNVAGRRVTSPIQGFGKLWQKTYTCRMLGAGASPQEVISTWKTKFPDFWPTGNRFYGPITGIAPGDVAVLNLGMPGGMKLSTGVFVLYADDESFTLMTPEGHMFASWITFSALEQDGVTVAQVQILLAGQRPDLRGRDGHGRSPQGGQVLGAHAESPGEPFRRNRGVLADRGVRR